MERSEFINKLYKEEIHHYDDYEKERLLNTSINSNIGDGNPVGHRNLIIVMEELAELSQEVSKQLREKGNYEGIVEEVADVFLGLEYVRYIVGIPPETLEKAIDIKLERLENVLKETGKFL